MPESRMIAGQIIYKNLPIKDFGIRSFLQMQSKVQRNEMVQTLIEEISKPSFDLPVAGSFSLGQFKEALAANDKRGTTGKIIF